MTTPDPVAAILAHIEAITPATARALVDALASLARPHRERPRCPAREDGLRCVHDEDHLGAHVNVTGDEWLAALLCRIGAREPLGPAVCARIEGHEGDCVPRYGVNMPPATEEEDRRLVSGARPHGASATGLAVPPRRKVRGVCRCGKARQEHDGATRAGGCAATGCARYQP